MHSTWLAGKLGHYFESRFSELTDGHFKSKRVFQEFDVSLTVKLPRVFLLTPSQLYTCNPRLGSGNIVRLQHRWTKPQLPPRSHDRQARSCNATG